MKWNILFCILSLTFVECKNHAKVERKEEIFYRDIGGLGFRRLPLIKPYEAKMVSDTEWRIELQSTTLLELSIKKAKLINVIDSVIFIYSNGGISIKAANYEEGWFVIIPSQFIENGFNNKVDYQNYLKSHGFKEPILIDVNNLYKDFQKNGDVKWQ